MPGDWAFHCGVDVIQNKQKQNKQKTTTNILSHHCCMWPSFVVWECGRQQAARLSSHPQVTCSDGGASGSTSSLRLSDRFAHVEQFSVEFSYRMNLHTEQKQGTHGMPWRRERKKTLCLAPSWAATAGKTITNMKYIGCSSTLQMLYSWREEVQLYISYIYTHVLLYGDKENDSIFTYLHNVLFQ